MFEQLGVFGNIGVLFASLAVLIKASSLAISNSVNLASVTGLGKTKVGFLLVAFSTSLPELFVVIFAIMDPETLGISLGNVLGSNIVNICLILGSSFFLMAWKYPDSVGFFTRMAREEVGNLNFGIFIASIVPLVLLYLGYASQLVGALLIGIFAFNIYGLSKKRGTVEEISAEAEKRNLQKYFSKAFIGIIGIVVCAYFIVESASVLAINAGVPPVIVGATVVAFGTSIPELATSLDSVRKGFLDLAVGNVIGSCFLNITLILGLTFLLAPFNVNMSAFSDLILFSLIANTMLWYMVQNTNVSRREGLILLGVYSIFLAISFSLS
ncbi:sodium:calcium antiporter [Candidatus Bathyarchaeota archaeon]|nr:sodium:calcium antiporter [Candidatus Bathyarchaeota archaeon]